MLKTDTSESVLTTDPPVESVLKTDPSIQSVLTVSSVTLQVDKPQPPKTCRQKLKAFMRSNAFHYAIMILVFLDCMMILGELLVQNAIVSEHTEIAEIDSNGQRNRTRREDPRGEPEAPRHRNNEPEHILSDKDRLARILHFCGLASVSSFIIEIILKIFAEGKDLLHQPEEIFDILVVITSMSLDVVFTIVQIDATAQSLTGLVIVLRLWRVSRIVNGLIESVKLEHDKKVKKENLARLKAEKQRDKMHTKLKTYKQENKELMVKLNEHRKVRGVSVSAPRGRNVSPAPKQKESNVDMSSFAEPSIVEDASSMYSSTA